MTPRRALPPLLVAALALGQLACASARTVLVDAEEYGLYRQARAEKTVLDRLAASQRYLTDYPDGVYSAELRDFFRRAEPDSFATAKTSIAGLEAYLRALPKGPNAGEASLRLRDLRALDKAERSDLAGAALVADESVAREAERRRAVRDRLEQWIGIFLDPAAFASPLVAAPASVIVPWSLALPWPVCERTDSGPDAPRGPPGAARRCAKLLQLDYRAVDDGETQDRQALVEVAVWQDEPGNPIEVRVGGPDLFLRIDETFTARGASASDPEARLRGAERAVELATAVFTTRVDRDPACKKASDADVLRLACKGIELRVLASALDGEDDRFVIRPAR